MTVSGRGSFRAPDGRRASSTQRPSWKRRNGGTPRTDKRADGAEKAEEVREFTCADYLPPSLARLRRLSFLAHFRPKTRAERRVLDSRKISGCECVACQQPVNASPSSAIQTDYSGTAGKHDKSTSLDGGGLQALRFCFRHGHFRILYYCCSPLVLWPPYRLR